MKEYFGDSLEGEEEVGNEVYKVIYDNSLPLFRRMIESGNVRVTFLDTAKVSQSVRSKLVSYSFQSALTCFMFLFSTISNLVAILARPHQPS
jgi:hypothetical protein